MDDEDDDEERFCILLKAGDENARTLGFLYGNSVINFLNRDAAVTARDCHVPNVAQHLWLDFKYDIDGIVGTFSKFAEVKANFTYVAVLPRDRQSLIPVYNIIRKHFPLSSFSGIAFQYLKWSKSAKLFDADGFDFHLALLPKKGQRVFKRFTENELVNEQYSFFKSFREQISHTLVSLPPAELHRNTILKNRILGATRWRVVSGDREFFLDILDKALQATTYDSNFEPHLIAFKLGDRDSSQCVKISVFDTCQAQVTVHAAITVSSPFLNQHLFWSRHGLQELVGERGTFLRALTLTSCCTFQSNLDGRLMDISPELRRICKVPTNMTFIQFYADTPHLHTTFVHPVSGIIVSCGVLHKNILEALNKRSAEYISTCRENALKLGMISSRVEIVSSVPGLIDVVNARDIFNVQEVRKLLENYPLLVPFSNSVKNEFGKSCMDIFKSIPMHIYETLESLHNQYRLKGGFFPVWKAYQYELANELFWKGKPTAPSDNVFGINLGPGGSGPDRSLTWENGFLCLEDAESCALNTHSSPPLIFWKLKSWQKDGIRRIFTFVDVINGGLTIVGKRAMMIFFQDMLADPCCNVKVDRGFIADLKQERPPRWAKVTGAVSLDKLTSALCKRKMYGSQYMFGRACELMEEHSINVNDAIQSGINTLNIRYFPDIRCRDSSRNSSISWLGNGILKICRDDTGFTEDKIVSKSLEVIHMLEVEGLVYKSKFERYLNENANFTFPWMYDILQRSLTIECQDHTKLLTYLSCIGLFQNHWFIDFRHFKRLHQSLLEDGGGLELSLQQCEILSIFRISLQSNLRVCRLHESIPHYIEENHKLQKGVKEQIQSSDEEQERDMEEYDNDITTEMENVTLVKRKQLPFGIKKKWTTEETEIVDHVISLNLKDEKRAYSIYIEFCRRKNIADRNFSSFKNKYHRLKIALRKNR